MTNTLINRLNAISYKLAQLKQEYPVTDYRCEVCDKNNQAITNIEELRRKKLKIILDKYYFSIAALAEKINISRNR